MYISLKLAVITVITCINPIYPHEQYLQHAGTVLLPMPLPFPVGGDFQFPVGGTFSSSRKITRKKMKTLFDTTTLRRHTLRNRIWRSAT